MISLLTTFCCIYSCSVDKNFDKLFIKIILVWPCFTIVLLKGYFGYKSYEYDIEVVIWFSFTLFAAAMYTQKIVPAKVILFSFVAFLGYVMLSS
jgi:high-affinity Fe2+/Pb2+ permease